MSKTAIQLLVFVLVGQSGSVHADYIIETVSTGPTQETTDFSLALTIPKFNTALGTLQDVIISYTDRSTISGSLTNTSASPQSFTVRESTVYDLSLGSNLLLTNTLMASQSYTSLAPFQSASFGSYTPSGSAGPLTLTSGAIFNSFLDAKSNIAVDFSTLTTTRVVGGGGNVSTGIYTTAGTTLTIRYDYVVPASSVGVPEPSGAVLTAVGGLVLAWAGWIKQQARVKARP